MLKFKVQYMPPDEKSWLIWKDPDTGIEDWRLEEKGPTEDEMVGWMWVWENSGSWWWTWRPGVLRFMELQRVGHNWMTELNWTENRRSRNSLNPSWDSCLLWGWWWGGEVLEDERKDANNKHQKNTTRLSQVPPSSSRITCAGLQAIEVPSWHF